ncbi:POM121-like protein 12 isoform X1 [Equus asinus]|uniref:POM121 transmembrane nucleoporin like 12 n=1 Tax=Equus asinus TaxID=9793 RepID=A0A9L0IX68_EQUAS
MGSYLGTAEAAQPPPAPDRRSQRPRPAGSQQHWDQCPVNHVHPERWTRTQPRHTSMGLDLSENQKSFRQRWLWNARNPRHVRSPVTVKINPPERRGSVSRGPPPEEPPDPCAKETVLRALSQCQKGKKKFDGPLWFEIPDPEERSPSPQPRPSAFQPVRRNGVTPSFVPRPGPLRSNLRH